MQLTLWVSCTQELKKTNHQQPQLCFYMSVIYSECDFKAVDSNKNKISDNIKVEVKLEQNPPIDEPGIFTAVFLPLL